MKTFFVMLGDRFSALVAKLFALKTLFFALACWYFYIGKLEWYGWLVAGAMFLGLRYMEKLGSLGNFKK